eukprot:Hpha_TRINITY_DN15835_c0_g2::TRINITY_DN15835_c0_g2_i1::g.188762::m.188762/K07750/E1.14.13.72, SC4MOL, ERG25; methylsterol monooxygenase
MDCLWLLERPWGFALDVTEGMSPEVRTVLFAATVNVVIYLIFGLTHLAVDITQRPTWFYDTKIQKVPYKVEGGRAGPPLWRVVFWVAVSLFVSVPAGLALLTFGFGALRVERDLPGLWEFARDAVISLLLTEPGFYYSHRLLHQPMFYRFHKMHHEFHSPIALATLYSHPLEVILGNIIAVTTGPFLLNSHLITLCLLSPIGIISSMRDHTGYAFWSSEIEHQPHFHDFHHSANCGNYGVVGLLDWIHGTDKAFRKAREEARKKRAGSTSR